MENNQDETSETIQPAIQLQITPDAIALLGITARWTKFLAILGFLMTGFLVLAGIVLTLFFGAYRNELEHTGLLNYFNSNLIGIIYLAIAVIFVLPIISLNNFSNAATRALKTGATDRLTFAFRNLKRFFKFIGIMTIAGLVIYLVVIVFAIGAGIFMLKN